MITLPLNAKDDDVLQLVHAWIELLAQDKDDEAFAVLGYALGEDWSPKLIRTLLTNYGSVEPRRDGKTFHVTSLNDNPSLPEGRTKLYQDVEWHKGRRNCVGMVHFDLPLNREFSDLTALFNIVKIDEGLALELHDIHVL